MYYDVRDLWPEIAGALSASDGLRLSWEAWRAAQLAAALAWPG